MSVPSPYVSIIIPCFNAEQYIADTIRSAQQQTYPHKEVIVIDDGSSDGSVEILKSFADSITWETGPNRGACAARNRGLQLAKGERIQFLDADDWLYPQKLERQIECIRQHPNSTPVCDWEVNEPGQTPKRVPAPSTSDDPLLSLLYGPLQTSSPLHNRADLTRIGGFREDLPCSQERDLHLRLASYGWPIHRIAEPLYAVRRVAGSVSGNYERVLDQHAGIAHRIREILVSRDAWNDTSARHVAGFLTRDARAYINLGLDAKADRYFSLAREYHKSGGWDLAYGRLTRLGATILGPVTLEKLRLRLRRK
ncbi:MAG: glycosyltransferase [Planctomycetaceae bacterium]